MCCVVVDVSFIFFSLALFYDKFMLYVRLFPSVDLEQLSLLSQKPANELNFLRFEVLFYALYSSQIVLWL